MEAAMNTLAAATIVVATGNPLQSFFKWLGL